MNLSNLSEQDNNAFSNFEGGQICIVNLEEFGQRLWIEFNPNNYPMWSIKTVTMMDADLQVYIEQHLSYWCINKCQFNINVDNGSGMYVVANCDDIVIDIVEDIVAKAEKYDFDPTQTDGMAQDAIHDSASALGEPLRGYTVTPYIMDQAMAALYSHPAFSN